jgi:hypothetical protein
MVKLCHKFPCLGFNFFVSLEEILQLLKEGPLIRLSNQIMELLLQQMNSRSHESSQNSSGEKYKTDEQVLIYLQYFHYIFHYETGLQEGEKYDEFIVQRSDS